MKTHEILQKMWKQENPTLLESGFHIIGFDKLNPWGGSSYLLSGDDIRHLTAMGIRILATPHIGLHWPSNNMYPHIGVTICDYMGNQSVRDTADEPETIFEGGSKHHCAVQQGAVLSPYLQVSSERVLSNGFRSARQFAQCSNLGHVHHLAKKKALGDKQVILDADLLEVPFVIDFFEVLLQNENYILQGYETGIFNRFVSSVGVVNQVPAVTSFDVIDSFLEMKKGHKHMIEKDVLIEISGYFPIKESLIMLDAITCYWHQREKGIVDSDNHVGDAFAVSGIDMIHYLKGKPLRDVLSRMFHVLRASGKFPWLPNHLRHNIIPGGLFRFLPSCKEFGLQESIVDILDIMEERSRIDKKISSCVSNSPTIPDHVLQESKSIATETRLRLDRYRTAMGSRRGFSQYDILNGEYVDPLLLQRLSGLTFDQIAKSFSMKS